MTSPLLGSYLREVQSLEKAELGRRKKYHESRYFAKLHIIKLELSLLLFSSCLLDLLQNTGAGSYPKLNAIYMQKEIIISPAFLK
jgi:hypothetical protein